MKTYPSSAALLVACVLCVSCERESAAADEEPLRLIDLQGRGCNESIATPDESVVAFRTTGPLPVFRLAKGDLSSVLADAPTPDACAASRSSSKLVLTFSVNEFTIRSVPDLVERQKLALDSEGRRAFHFTTRLCAYRAGWIAVGKGIIKIEPNPWRLSKVGRLSVARAKGAAVDEKTGTVVVCGDGGMAEIFDLVKMKSSARCSLGSEAGYGACASDGIAWIPTRDGRVLHVDIASATVVGRTALTPERRRTWVRLDLAPSGRHLAASACRRGEGETWPTVIRVFRVERARLREVAAIRRKLGAVVCDLTILEKGKRVLVGTPRFALEWNYRPRSDKAGK